MAAGLVWTINCIVFVVLFAIWNKSDLMNFCFKMLFLGLAVINAAPAWTFLQKTIQ